jgi:hypothetical protein
MAIAVTVPLARLLAARKDAAGFARVAQRIAEGITTLGQGVSGGQLSPDQWQAEMARLLMAGGLASYAEGRGVPIDQLAPRTRAEIARYLSGQVDYLNRFADEIDADGWKPGYEARAQMYGRSLRALYEKGATFGLPLPAMPGEGSECLTNCRCRWRVEWIDRENLDADCYWVMGQAEHCPTCQDRADKWAPLRIRGGKLRVRVRV